MNQNILRTAALFLGILFLFVAIENVLAHGVIITHNASVGVEIVAVFDNGQAIADGQVTVYAPNDLSQPWLTGTTDAEGHFFFTPDPTIPGTWDVQVRQAGHGGVIHIAIADGQVSAESGGFTTMQIILMSASVIWGLVGTALYFSGRAS